MTSLLVATALFATAPAPRYRVVMAPKIAIVPSLSGSKAELKIGDLRTGVFVYPTADIEALGFNAKRQPFLGVSVYSSGAITLSNQWPVFPFGNSYKRPANLPNYEEIAIQDVNRAGQVVVTFDESWPDSLEAFSLEEVPYAKLYRAGAWTDVGRADEAKINDRGDIMGITRIGMAVSEVFLISNGKRKVIGPATNALLTESGDVLHFDLNHVAHPTETRFDPVVTNAEYYSKGRRTPFFVRKGFVPIAIWSKHRFIAHESVNTDADYLVENGRYTKLEKLTAGLNGREVDVKRLYADGSIWVQFAYSNGTRSDAFLVPIKRSQMK